MKTERNKLTLNLHKECAGYYSNEFEGLRVVVSNPQHVTGDSKTSWQLTIELDYQLIYSDFFSTKREAYASGAKWLIDNL